MSGITWSEKKLRELIREEIALYADLTDLMGHRPERRPGGATVAPAETDDPRELALFKEALGSVLMNEMKCFLNRVQSAFEQKMAKG